MQSRKRGPGRPPRERPVERLVVLLPPELKLWLRHRAIEEGADMSAIVARLVESYRGRVKR